MQMVSSVSKRVTNVWWLLKLTYGLVPIVAGLDKFFNILVSWPMYLNPLLPQTLGVSAQYCCYGIGVIEILAGLLVFSKWTRYGAYLVSLWLVLIAVNLVSLKAYYDVAVRDVVMAMGAYALAKLTEEVESK